MEVESKPAPSAKIGKDLKKPTCTLENKKMNPANSVSSRSRVRRPDIQLYVPRGRRLEQRVDPTPGSDKLENSAHKTSNLDSQYPNHERRSSMNEVPTRNGGKYSGKKVDTKESSLESDNSGDGRKINGCKKELSNTDNVPVVQNGGGRNSEIYNPSVFSNRDTQSEINTSNEISNNDSLNSVCGNIIKTNDHIIMSKENNSQNCNSFNNKESGVLLDLPKQDQAVPEDSSTNKTTECESNTKYSINVKFNLKGPEETLTSTAVGVNNSYKLVDNGEQNIIIQTELNRNKNSVQSQENVDEIKVENEPTFPDIRNPLLTKPATSLGSNKHRESGDLVSQNNDNTSETRTVTDVRGGCVVSGGKQDSGCYMEDSNSSGYSEDCDSIKDDSWDVLFDVSGDSITEDILQELTKQVGCVTVEKAKLDYLSWRPREPQMNDSDYGHVVEIYDFPEEFKTQDLMAAFSDFRERYFDIKWVDDTHALGVFSSPITAQEALALNHPFMKIRPLSEATILSKAKARKAREFMQPYKPRPATSASLARRLVTGALGLKVQVPKEQRDMERQKLKEAKERRRLAVRQREDAWNGTIID